MKGGQQNQNRTSIRRIAHGASALYHGQALRPVPHRKPGVHGRRIKICRPNRAAHYRTSAAGLRTGESGTEAETAAPSPEETVRVVTYKGR